MTARDEPGVRPEPLFAVARGWLRDALELARVRLALLGVEAAEHALALGTSLALLLAAALLLSAALVSALVLVTVLLWDTQRVLALALACGVLLSAGGLAGWVGLQRLRAVAWFEASRAELARDVERLRGGPRA